MVRCPHHWCRRLKKFVITMFLVVNIMYILSKLTQEEEDPACLVNNKHVIKPERKIKGLYGTDLQSLYVEQNARMYSHYVIPSIANHEMPYPQHKQEYLGLIKDVQNTNLLNLHVHTPNPGDLTLDKMVPFLIHFIWIGKNKTMSFINYLSILSAHKHHRTATITLHYDYKPDGPWWAKVCQEIPNIRTVHQVLPKTVLGQPLRSKSDKIQVLKLVILMYYGGVFIENNVIVLKSLDTYRKFDTCVNQWKSFNKVNPSIVFSQNNASFIILWHGSYKTDYKPDLPGYNSGVIPFKLYKRYPFLAHLTKWQFVTPDLKELAKLMDGTIDWSDLFFLNMGPEASSLHISPDSIKNMDGTLGEMLRSIFYR